MCIKRPIIYVLMCVFLLVSCASNETLFAAYNDQFCHMEPVLAQQSLFVIEAPLSTIEVRAEVVTEEQHIFVVEPPASSVVIGAIKNQVYLVEPSVAMVEYSTVSPVAPIDSFLWEPAVYFAFDSAAISAHAKRRVMDNINLLKKYPDFYIAVRGFTDSQGLATYNSALSSKRAHGVANLMASQGIAKQRIKVSGLGESAPLASELHRDEREDKGNVMNRRVEMILVDENNRPASMQFIDVDENLFDKAAELPTE